MSTRASIAFAITLGLVASALAPVATASAAIVFTDDLESGAPGWSTTGLWNLSTRAAASPTHSFHYGVERADGTSDYDTGARNSGDLVSPAIDLSGLARAKVAFWSEWSSEGGCSYEHPMIFVENATGDLTLAREMCDQSASGRFEANLSAFVGQTVRVVFRWDTIDRYANAYEGWYVDDISVSEADARDVVTAPDLVIGGIDVAPTPTAGSPATVQVAVHNAGTAPTDAPFAVAVSFDGAPLARPVIAAGFAPGATILLNATMTMPAPGGHTIRAVADVDDNVSELDETNNARSIDIAVGASIVDLGARNVTVPLPLYADQPFLATAQLRIVGNASTLGSFSLAWRLDNATIATRVENGSSLQGAKAITQPFAGLAPGAHEIAIVLDPEDAVSEIDESNDTARVDLVVPEPAHVGLAIPDLHRVMIPTDAGDFANPLARYQATLRTCDAGAGATPGGSIALSIGSTLGATSLPTRVVPALAPGACSNDTFEFDAPGAIGDFTLHAQLAAGNDISREDDNASASSFHGVGGAGGVVLPDGAGAPLTPEEPLAPIAQNVTAIQSVVAAEENATLTEVGALEELAEGRPSAAALNLTHAGVCANSATCDATSGNAGAGNVRPCSAREPSASAGVPQWALWYAVHVYERRDVFVPESSPFTTNPSVPAGERHWPLPDTPLPVPGAAPQLCANAWDVASAADAGVPK